MYATLLSTNQNYAGVSLQQQGTFLMPSHNKSSSNYDTDINVMTNA